MSSTLQENEGRRWKIDESDAYSMLSDTELLEELRKLPDFDKYPLPSSWYKKFNLKPIEAVDIKSYINGGGFLKAIAGGHYDSYEVKEPQRDENGNLLVVPVFPEEKIPVQIISKPIREIPELLEVKEEIREQEHLQQQEKTQDCP